MSLDISGGINNSSDAITQVSELGVSTLKDKLNDLFDIENPDGVNAQLRTKNNENDKTTSKLNGHVITRVTYQDNTLGPEEQ